VITHDSTSSGQPHDHERSRLLWQPQTFMIMGAVEVARGVAAPAAVIAARYQRWCTYWRMCRS
jgi:hypothetical protein